MKKNSPKLYLDYASATPIDARVLKVLATVSKNVFANPSALHRLGVEAHTYLERARKHIAEVIGAHADEIVFVSGGTESDNLAVLGVVRAWKTAHPKTRPHIIVSAIEHAAVKATVEFLAHEGVDVSVLGVDQDGFVSPKELRKMIRPETILVSVMYVNNEIGTIQPIADIAKEIRHFKKFNTTGNPHTVSKYPLLHTDASQALNYLPITVEKLGVDLISMNGSKLYGLKGTGALWVKRGTPIASILFGGDQEHGLRPGTESLPAIVAFAEAVIIANAMRPKESVRLQKIQEYCFDQLQKLPYDIRINGARENRLPNNINISIPGFQSEMLVVYLDAQGVFVSAKSACKSTDPESSHVIEALGYHDVGDMGSLRISLGRETKKSDIDILIKALRHVFTTLKGEK